MTNLGIILTSSPSLDALREHTAGLDALKVVTGWGLPWTDELRREVARLCPTLIVRTVTGDPSYDGGRFALPDANQAIAEIEPWYAAWQRVARPDQRFYVEVGNEPLIGPPGGEATLSAARCWEYADLLAQTVIRLTARFPLASIILPAHLLNHPLRVGTHANGQAWMTDLTAQKLHGRGVLPLLRNRLAVGLHAYTEQQFEEGYALARKHFPGLPIWVTEFALNREMPPEVRGRTYALTAASWPVEGVLLYHLDLIGGTDPAHFIPHYRLDRATLQHFTAAPPLGTPMADAIHHTARIDRFDMDIWQWRTVKAFRAHLAQYNAKQTAPWARGVTYHHSESPIPATWKGVPSMLGMAEFYRDTRVWKRGPQLYTVSGAPNTAHDGIWQLTPLNLQGVHAGECNDSHWGIEVVGSYQTQRWDAGTSALALGAGRALLDWIGASVTAQTVKGHRDCLPNKDCPGKAIDMTAVRRGLEAL